MIQSGPADQMEKCTTDQDMDDGKARPYRPVGVTSTRGNEVVGRRQVEVKKTFKSTAINEQIGDIDSLELFPLCREGMVAEKTSRGIVEVVA